MRFDDDHGSRTGKDAVLTFVSDECKDSVSLFFCPDINPVTLYEL